MNIPPEGSVSSGKCLIVCRLDMSLGCVVMNLSLHDTESFKFSLLHIFTDMTRDDSKEGIRVREIVENSIRKNF